MFLVIIWLLFIIYFLKDIYYEILINNKKVNCDMFIDFYLLGVCYFYEIELKYMIVGFRYVKYLMEKVNLLKSIVFGGW